MKIKVLLKYGLVGAVLIAILAVTLTQFHLTSESINHIVEIAGVVVFLTLGVLLKKNETKKN